MGRNLLLDRYLYIYFALYIIIDRIEYRIVVDEIDRYSIDFISFFFCKNDFLIKFQPIKYFLREFQPIK